MKILVTGANGFIGSALCALLMQQGHEIHYVTTSYKKIKQTPNFRGFLWKPHAGEIDEACLKGVKAVVNLAGHTINCRWNNRNKKLILESRLNCSDVLFKMLSEKEHEVSYIVNASAIGIYESSETALYTEKTEHFGNDFLAEVCLKWENANKRFESLGIKTAIVRFGLILSKDEGVLHALANVVSKGLGAGLGNARQWMSWIHFEDVIQIIDLLIMQQQTGVFNIVAPSPVRQKVLLHMLAASLHKKVWLPNIPSSVLKAALGERAALVLSSQQVHSVRLEPAGYRFKFEGLDAALKDLYHS